MAKKKKFSADRIVSISAILMSLMTLVVLIVQTNMIRNQQRNSVYPHMIIGNQGYATANYKLILSNSGIGPAIIESVEINYQDSVYQMDFPTFIYNYIPETDTLENIFHSNVYPGMLIPAEKVINIIEVIDDEATAIALAQMVGELDFEMTIVYKSIYEERWKLSTETGTPELLD